MVSGSTIATTNVDGAYWSGLGEKIVYAAGRYWAFFWNKPSQYEWYYKSSTDGINWSSAQLIEQATGGIGWASHHVWWDGTYIQWLGGCGWGWSPDTVRYKRGVPSGSTITWEATRIVQGSGITRGHMTGIKDSNGYPWAFYGYYNSGVSRYEPTVVKSTALDGSAWAAGVNLDSANGGLGEVLIPLNGGSMCAMWIRYQPAEGSRPIVCKFYNGTSWDASATTIDSNIKDQNGRHDAVILNNEIHLVYVKGTTNYICYRKWTSSGGWEGESQLETSQIDTNTRLTMTKNPATNRIYLFWKYGNSIMKKEYVGGSWGGTSTFFSDSNIKEYITSYAEVYNNEVGLGYGIGVASPWTLKFYTLGVGPLALSLTESLNAYLLTKFLLRIQKDELFEYYPWIRILGIFVRSFLNESFKVEYKRIFSYVYSFYESLSKYIIQGKREETLSFSVFLNPFLFSKLKEILKFESIVVKKIMLLKNPLMIFTERVGPFIPGTGIPIYLTFKKLNFLRKTFKECYEIYHKLRSED